MGGRRRAHRRILGQRLPSRRVHLHRVAADVAFEAAKHSQPQLAASKQQSNQWRGLPCDGRRGARRRLLLGRRLPVWRVHLHRLALVARGGRADVT